MSKENHILGGILLLSGTAIGAGMLAMPTATAFAGFFPSLGLFFLCSLFMLVTAFFLLDVNLAIRGEPNLISMAGATLGGWGKAISWILYLLLLYSLVAAYIAGSAPLFTHAMHYVTHYTIPEWLANFCLPTLFGSVLYFGTQGVDRTNRILMVGLITAYVLLVLFVPSHIHPALLMHVDLPAAFLGIPILVTAFAYHVIIPTLTTYLHHDGRRLRKMILIGNAIPLLTYISWQLLVLGVVPLPMLATAWKQGVSAATPLASVLHSPLIELAAQFFSFFAIVTSFLGVTLSLSDFLIDGLKIKKSWEGRLGALLLTFVPPLLFVHFYKRGFYLALQHAGAIVAILFGLLPAAMAWTLKGHPFYHSTAGRSLLLLIALLSIGIVLIDFLDQAGLFHRFVAPYVSSAHPI